MTQNRRKYYHHYHLPNYKFDSCLSLCLRNTIKIFNETSKEHQNILKSHPVGSMEASFSLVREEISVTLSLLNSEPVCVAVCLSIQT